MGTSFWVKRFLLALIVASALLFLVQLIKGQTLTDGIQFALLWGAGSAALFTLIGYIRYRRNPACMVPSPKDR